MKLDEGTFCPFVKGKCRQRECVLFITVRGTDPQTGKEVDEPDCSLRWLPTLMIENAKNVRGVQAATESMRNEIVTRMDVPMRANAAQYDLIEDVINRAPKLIGPQ